eukprot:scaffold14522_cov90-Isochrysis_galbana.AAC.1
MAALSRFKPGCKGHERAGQRNSQRRRWRNGAPEASLAVQRQQPIRGCKHSRHRMMQSRPGPPGMPPRLLTVSTAFTKSKATPRGNWFGGHWPSTTADSKSISEHVTSSERGGCAARAPARPSTDQFFDR